MTMTKTRPYPIIGLGIKENRNNFSMNITFFLL